MKLKLTIVKLKKTNVLFLENRSITELWSGVAEALQQNRCICSLLQFNSFFGVEFPGPIYPIKKSHTQYCINEELEAFIKVLLKTDRSVYLHGANENEIKNVVISIMKTLEDIEFDVVVGEVTSVYERVVEFYCKMNNKLFLAPMTARIPIDRFFFLDGAFMAPLPIKNKLLHRSLTMADVANKLGENDLVLQANHFLILVNKIRVAMGWLMGERLHTPSPLKKLAINRNIKKFNNELSKLPFCKLTDIDESSVIYCMHVQPESTLDTYSPLFWDQAKTIELIAEACRDANRSFFVRFHPRSRYEVALHFEKIRSNNVRILSPDISMGNLLKLHPLIISVSGTVIIEAATEGSTCIALDDTYLSSFPGVKHIQLSQLREFLDGMKELPKVKKDDQVEWFRLINQYSHPGLIAPPEWSARALDDSNIKQIADALLLALNWAFENKRIGS